MPAPRRNDPLGITETPRPPKDASRLAELVEEFRQRAEYVERHYQFLKWAFGGDREFNASLAKLKRSLARKRKTKRRGDRAHPEIEMVITKFARDHARERTGIEDAEVTQRDADAGAKRAAEVLQTRRGRSRNILLRHHVEGLMALIQQMTGQPVMLGFYKEHDYAPYASNSGGRTLVMLARLLEPDVAETTLASMVRRARSKYAGKSMRFIDFFPAYFAKGSPLSGPVDIGNGQKIVGFEPNIPIYFP